MDSSLRLCLQYRQLIDRDVRDRQAAPFTGSGSCRRDDRWQHTGNGTDSLPGICGVMGASEHVPAKRPQLAVRMPDSAKEFEAAAGSNGSPPARALARVAP